MADQVSYDDVEKRFLPALQQLEFPQLMPRLPAEIEWEYACRAATQTPFWWGEVLSTDLANYDGTYPYHEGPTGELRSATLGVFDFFPNPWGLYQMHGNVWEWCEDVWRADETTAGDSDAGHRLVVRRGSWYGDGRFLRSAFRTADRAGSRDSALGFRMVTGPRQGE